MSPSWSAIAFIAALILLLWAGVDVWRGKTAFGKFRLTKEDSPDRFWFAIALYINLAFLLFWAGQKAAADVPREVEIRIANESGTLAAL